MKYYKVQVLLGHMGKGKGLPVWIYVESETLLEAIDVARNLHGVKHTRLPLEAHEIAYEEYLIGRDSKDYNVKMSQIFNQEGKDRGVNV